MKYLSFLFVLMLGVSTQVSAQQPTDLKSIHRILIAGDSITHHSPSPADSGLGWQGDWGMAATAADKDYVHLFLAKLAAAQGAGTTPPDFWISGEGGGKITDQLKFADKITAYHADLALVQLGENDRVATVEAFQQPYEQLLAAIRAGNPNVRILCVGVWGIWPTGDHTKDNMIRAACQKYGATFADLGDAFTKPENQAKSENRYTVPGINWHPSDSGMAAYADAFWQALMLPPSAPDAAAAEAPSPATPTPPTASSAATGDGQPVEVDETWGATPDLPWGTVPTIEQQDGKNVAKISSATTVGDKSETPLDISKFAGREVTIHTRVKADSVSEPPNVWNGIKLTLRLRNAEGALDYPDYRFPAGTFDWKDVSWKLRIPDNIVGMDLMIGLENVSGTVWYDGIQITAGK
jgi:lysophospholipase L1-like esterase